MATTATFPAHKQGIKRLSDDGLESEQRLAKRFNLLNLDHNGKLWIPTPSPPQPPGPSQQEPVAKPYREPDDLMQVEDTKDRIYIHNLDEELDFDEDTPEEDRLVFLGDVERHLDKIPKHILRGKASTSAPSAANQLVLYSVPSSLSVPEELDGVRKAVIESRARVRERQEQLAAEQMKIHDNAMVDEYPVDEDAMDIG